MYKRQAHLQKVLAVAFSEVEVIAADCSEIKEDSISNKTLEELFIAAKKVEGCSEKSLKYYASTTVSYTHLATK